MAGINGLTEGFRADANVRINKFAAMVKSVANTSNRTAKYAAVPTASNAAGFLGVLVDHFVEPNYFVPEGTVSTTVTGTVPTLYNMMGKGMTLQVNGKARFICASAVNQGDELIIADAYGRVMTNNITTGNVAYVVGIAEHATVNAEDIVEALVQPYAKKM
jgi:glutamate synthase domain-containing protein 3